MTFLSWISSCSRPAILNITGDNGATPARSPRMVPTEYLPLHQYLKHRYASLVVLTFEQIESLLGFALPEAAITDLGWWTDERATDVHTETWRSAGRHATPNLLAGNVRFERQS